MTLDELNAASPEAATEAFTRCCGASRWAGRMASDRPYPNAASLLAHADEVWAEMAPEDVLEAFRHHPRIGDRASLRAKFATTADWAENEQAGTNTATESVLDGLEAGNAAYEAKFGYIFIICASGKSAAEMLEALTSRLGHAPEAELAVAAEEQRRITKLRLEKLLTP